MAIYGGPSITTDGLEIALDSSTKINYPIDELYVEYLIVAGGGGGSGWGDGVGGGAGGVLTGSTTFPRGDYSVVVGAGGSAGGPSSATRGSNGSNSSLGDLTAIGGGGGGSKNTNDGLSGGCGGGGYGDNVAPSGVGGSGTVGQGFAGGDGTHYYRGGGGGGAGGVGQAGSELVVDGLARANGGVGRTSIIEGISKYYGGGGGSGGCCDRGTGTGGLGGGGDGGNQNIDGTPGTTNTGGGGGGGGSYFNRPTVGGNGASGIVVIRYAGSQKATGGTITQSGGFTTHVFNSSGTFSVSNSPAGSLTNSIFDLVGIAASAAAPTFNDVKKGVLSFDGVDDHIVLSHNFDLNNTITFDFVFKFNSLSPVNPRIFEIRDSSYSLQLLRDDATGKIATWSSKINASANSALSWFTPSSGIFYFVTVVFSSSETKLFLNGEELSSSGTTSVSSGNRDNKIVIGARGDLEPTTFLNGGVAYFRIYNRALSSLEIRNNYRSLKSRYL